MSQPAACSIVSNNYLAFARVLARSFKAHHPEGRFWVLIADRAIAELDYEAEPFEVVFADQLEIPAFEAFAFRHSILELNTAVKPYFLSYLDRRFDPGALCYLDPDILVLGDLTPVYRKLEEQDLLLTPHVTRPVTDDHKPGERDLLLAGAYNLGFLGVSLNPTTREFLSWWQEKLYLECRHRVRDGLFVDQRWMDLAPSLVERTHVLRDPGYNVAYWNLVHRTLVREPGADRWTVDGRALRFFHFSGIDPARPEILSRHQDRYSLSDRPDVAPLFRLYLDRLESEGHRSSSRIPYGFGSFENGVSIPACAREAYRRIDPEGRRWPRPFEIAGGDGFFDWLRRPAEGELLPRLVQFLWEERADLQTAFPALSGEPGRQLARWLLEDGGRAAGIDEAFLEELPERSLAAAPSAAEESVSWLVGDAGLEPDARPRIPRLAMRLRERRPDLERAFPDPLGTSRPRFALWYVTHGRREYGLGAELVEPVLGSLDFGRRLRARIWWALKGG